MLVGEGEAGVASKPTLPPRRPVYSVPGLSLHLGHELYQLDERL